jgi:arylsulfatase A-like enzyme
LERFLKAVDDLGIGNDTIVLYTTNNGPHQNSWPDAGTTPFRKRKEHQLGRRVPRAVHDPLPRRKLDSGVAYVG